MTTCTCANTTTYKGCPQAEALLSPEEWDALSWLINEQCSEYYANGDISVTIGFTSKDEVYMIDPFYDEDMIDPVNPVHYYGDNFTWSPMVAAARMMVKFAKREVHKS